MPKNTDMRIKKPLWDVTSHPLSFPELKKNLKTDICIIGAGITGLSLAYLLTAEGKKVVVVDKGEVGFGETGVTTAHLTNILDDHYFTLKKLHGCERTKLIFESHTTAIDLIESIVQKEKIDCDFSRVDGYLFLGPNDKEKTLEREFKMLRSICDEKCDEKTLRQKNGPKGAEFGSCLKFPDQAQFHPLKYLNGLAKIIQKNGGEIYVNSMVQSFKETKEEVVIKLANGLAVSAETVVMATNAPFDDKSSFMYAKQAAYRTYTIAVEIPENSVTKGLYWDTAKPYHYTRQFSFKDSGSRARDFLIVGGEDHKTGQLKKGVNPYSNLLEWAQEKFPMIKTETIYEWSGQILNTMDGIAFIGLNPGNKRVYVATGYSGNGMTYGTMAATIVKDLICGKKNPLAQLYSPARFNLKGAGRFMKEGLDVAVEYFGGLVPKENIDLKNLPNGMGTVISDGLKKTAVYKDKEGKICKYSAVCPHLGCSVRWNKTAASWDCPCHGSRFDAHGKVLNGPAKTDLKPL